MDPIQTDWIGSIVQMFLYFHLFGKKVKCNQAAASCGNNSSKVVHWYIYFIYKANKMQA